MTINNIFPRPQVFLLEVIHYRYKLDQRQRRKYYITNYLLKEVKGFVSRRRKNNILNKDDRKLICLIKCPLHVLSFSSLFVLLGLVIILELEVVQLTLVVTQSLIT